MSIFVFINPTGGKPLCYIEKGCLRAAMLKAVLLFQSKSRFPTWYCSVYLPEFLRTLYIAKWTFCVQQFFSAKTYLQSSYYKNWECKHCFFSSPLSFFFYFPSPSLVWFSSFSGLRTAFWRFFTQMTANFVRLVFRKSVRAISCQTLPSYCLT